MSQVTLHYDDKAEEAATCIKEWFEKQDISTTLARKEFTAARVDICPGIGTSLKQYLELVASLNDAIKDSESWKKGLVQIWAGVGNCQEKVKLHPTPERSSDIRNFANRLERE